MEKNQVTAVYIPSGTIAPEIVKGEKMSLIKTVEDLNGMVDFAKYRVCGKMYYFVVGDSSFDLCDSASTIRDSGFVSKGKRMMEAITMGPAMVFSASHTPSGGELGTMSEDDLSNIFSRMTCIDGEYACRID